MRFGKDIGHVVKILFTTKWFAWWWKVSKDGVWYITNQDNIKHHLWLSIMTMHKGDYDIMSIDIYKLQISIGYKKVMNE